jgi:hypothetical protein
VNQSQAARGGTLESGARTLWRRRRVVDDNSVRLDVRRDSFDQPVDSGIVGHDGMYFVRSGYRLLG